MVPLILTIDLEWYYNGNQQGRVADFAQKSLAERYQYDRHQIEKSTLAILKILKKYRQKITFFVVAELDQVYPKIIPQILYQGHEIALHSYRHDEARTANALEKDLTASQPFQKKYGCIGFRSPRIKMSKKQLKVIKKFGYQYDSSVYGTTIFDFAGLKILPVSVLPFTKKQLQKIPSNLDFALLKKCIPFGSGMLTGLLQKNSRWLIGQYWRGYHQPACLFLHSWQINKPYYPAKFLLKSPFMIPYSFECRDLLEFFCRHYRLLRARDYLDK